MNRQDNYFSLTISTIVLATGVGDVIDSSGRLQRIRMLLDSGSQSYFLTLSAGRLELPIEKIKSSIFGFGAVSKAVGTKTMFIFSSIWNQNNDYDINSFVIDKIVDRMASITIEYVRHFI